MAFGSNITSMERWNLPDVKDQTDFLFQAGTLKRQEAEKKSATTAVAEARRSARERYMSKVDERGRNEFNKSREALQQELKMVEEELKELDKQISAIKSQEMAGYKPAPMSGYRPAIPNEVISSPLQQTERPLFGGF